jgi:hypothetical protein
VATNLAIDQARRRGAREHPAARAGDTGRPERGGPGDGIEAVQASVDLHRALKALPDAAVPEDPDDTEGSEDQVIGCSDALEQQRFGIELGAPLGDRDVFDGVGSEPKLVHRLAELVDVTAVPDGWTTDAPLPVGSSGWQQTFQARPASPTATSCSRSPMVSDPPPTTDHRTGCRRCASPRTSS